MKKKTLIATFALATTSVLGAASFTTLSAQAEPGTLTDVTYTSEQYRSAINGPNMVSCDVTGDGVEDVIVARNWWRRSANSSTSSSLLSPGAVYVIPGGNFQGGELDNPESGAIRIEGGFYYKTMGGQDVSCLGDVNKDGINDFAVSEPFANRASVIYGSSDMQTMNLSHLGDKGFQIKGTAYVGQFLSDASGDIDGDGNIEIAIGEYDYPNSTKNIWHWYRVPADGVSTIDFDNDTPVLSLSANRSDVSMYNGDLLDDFNGDGKPDFLTGAQTKVRIVTDLSTSVDFSDNGDPESLIHINGERTFVSGANGYDMDSLGDINGDGLTDVIIGNPANANSGAIIVLGAKNNNSICTDPSKTPSVYECEDESAMRGWVITADNGAGYTVDAYNDGTITRIALGGNSALKKAYVFDPSALPATGETTDIRTLDSTLSWDYVTNGGSSVAFAGMQPSGLDSSKQSLHLAINAPSDLYTRIVEVPNTSTALSLSPQKLTVLEANRAITPAGEAPMAPQKCTTFFKEDGCFTVSFDANGGTGEKADETVASGGTLTLPAADTFTAPDGKEFDKWDAGNPGEEISITKDTTITAQWKDIEVDPAVYTITYDLNGGTLDGQTGSVSVEAEDGTTITLPEPTREGYTFDYWEGSRYAAGDSYTVTANHTFTAQWKTNDASGNTGNNGNQNAGTDNTGNQSASDTNANNSDGQSTTAKPGNVNVKTSPDTGDDTNLTLWIVVMLAALAGVAGIGATIIHKRKANE